MQHAFKTKCQNYFEEFFCVFLFGGLDLGFFSRYELIQVLSLGSSLLEWEVENTEKTKG